jgi:hypothetical protein
VSAVAKAIAIAAVVALGIGIRRVNQRWFTAVRASQPTNARGLRIESRLADAVFIVMVVLVSLGILAA